MPMTSRERVLMALNHEEPDRVPLFIGTSGATSVLGAGYPGLRRHLGLPGRATRYISKPLPYVKGITTPYLRELLRHVGPYVDVLVTGDDLGSQDSTLMSPATYRRLIKPHQADVIKVFPAPSVGPGFFAEIQGPFPGGVLMAAGGMSPANLGDDVAKGAQIITFPANGLDAQAYRSGRVRNITRVAKHRVAAVRQARTGAAVAPGGKR